MMMTFVLKLSRHQRSLSSSWEFLRTFKKPATNYYRISRDPETAVETTAQLFLGVRIQCAKCHNHPFERWTQDDYYGFAAFFSQIGRKKGNLPDEEVVYATGSERIVAMLGPAARAFEYRHTPDPREIDQILLPTLDGLRGALATATAGPPPARLKELP